VRFAVAVPGGQEAKRKGKSAGSLETARSIRVDYVCERAHLPVAHGELEFDFQQSAWTRRHEDKRVQKMAECFLESYLRKKS